MDGDRQLCAQPAERRTDRRQRRDTDCRQTVQDKVAAIEGDQFADRRRQKQAARTDEQRGKEPAERALHSAEIVERPPDEGVGGADQLGDLDFRGLCQYLEAEGVESDGDQGTGEQAAQ